MPECNIFDMLM